MGPADARVPDAVFSEHAGVTFYSTEQMNRETEWWRSLACEGSALLGQRDRDRPPGDVEPSQFVLIGDVGIGLDSPFALDYRTSINDPQVIHLQSPRNSEVLRPFQQ